MRALFQTFIRKVQRAGRLSDRRSIDVMALLVKFGHMWVDVGNAPEHIVRTTESEQLANGTSAMLRNLRQLPWASNDQVLFTAQADFAAPPVLIYNVN